MGPGNASNLRINKNGSGALFNGTMVGLLTISEIAP